jgi:hypothetical protein
MEILKNIVNSKKFWYAFGMFIRENCSSAFGITEGEMANLIYVGIALIVAQGIADRKSCGK